MKTKINVSAEDWFPIVFVNKEPIGDGLVSTNNPPLKINMTTNSNTFLIRFSILSESNVESFFMTLKLKNSIILLGI